MLLLAGCKSQSSQQQQKPMAMPPVPVTVAKATSEDVPLDLHAVGTVEASSTIQIKSRIAGEIMNVRFTEGGNVNKGDLLFEIDQRPYREALRQAEAAVARDKAQLNQAEANRGRDAAQLKNAETVAARYESLLSSGVISKELRDQSVTSADALREAVKADAAAIESARAAGQSSQAALERAKLDISYTEIRSPVSGRAGNLLIHSGNLVKDNADTIVTINQVSPIFVSFSVPEQYLAAVREGANGKKLSVLVSLQDGSGKATKGTLAVIDNTVDPSTGTIKLKATFPNQDNLLWPGQFVDAVITLETRTGATVIPSEAIQAGQKGSMVYVVKPDQTAEPRVVDVGPNFGHKVVINKGIAPGDTVVTDGQMRLFPGSKVKLVPAVESDSQPL